MERPITLPNCEYCGVSLGARLDRDKHWSHKDKKWLDLCTRCTHWMFHREWVEGFAPPRDLKHT